MKLYQLMNSAGAIMRFKKDCSLEASKAFDFNDFIEDAQKELSNFDKVRVDKIKEYGEELDGGYKVKDENIEKFNKEIQELLNKEIDIKIPEIKRSDMRGYILSDDAGILSWLIQK